MNTLSSRRSVLVISLAYAQDVGPDDARGKERAMLPTLLARYPGFTAP